MGRKRNWRWELGGGGLPVGPKTAIVLSYVFIAVLSLMEHVKTFNVRYFSKESFCLTIMLNNVNFKGEYETPLGINF